MSREAMKSDWEAGYETGYGAGYENGLSDGFSRGVEEGQPLMKLAKSMRVPLTDEQIYSAIRFVDSLRAVDVARAIERAHGIGGNDE